MSMKESQTPARYEKLIKALQIASFVFMLAMVALCIWFLAKNHISVKTADQLTCYLTGGAWTAALILIGFSVVKSFALVFPPAVLFVLSGLGFDSFWKAVLVNAAATALSLILPYYLGRFTGKDMVSSLKRRFKAVQKLDDFAGENDFALVLIIKGGGLLPSDLSSLLFGAMGIPFWAYFLASNLGMLFLNVLWTLVGWKGDLQNPLSFLYALPALIFAVAAALGIGIYKKKKQQKETARSKEETP